MELHCPECETLLETWCLSGQQRYWCPTCQIPFTYHIKEKRFSVYFPPPQCASCGSFHVVTFAIPYDAVDMSYCQQCFACFSQQTIDVPREELAEMYETDGFPRDAARILKKEPLSKYGE